MAQRVVLVHLNSLDLGGTQISAVDFAAAVVPLGFDSYLVGPERESGGPSVLDVARERGVAVHPYRQPESMLAHGRMLSRMAADVGADLVHAYGTWGAARSIYWGPSRWGRTPWLMTMYEMSLHHSVHRHMPLVVGTEYLLEECTDRPGYTTLISPPVDLTRDVPSPPADGRAGTTAVLVSRLDEEMKSVAVETAIRAMAHLADTEITLQVVGSGTAAERLGDLASSVNTRAGRRVVDMVGPMADPRGAYARADVVLGMGSSAARGLAHGKPLVVQGENGWSAILTPETAATHARNSYWNDEHVQDPELLLARHLRELAGDPQARRRLGAFGRTFAERRFGLVAMAEKLADTYQRTLSGYTGRQWRADLPLEARRVPRAFARVGREGLDRLRHAGLRQAAARRA